MTIENPVYRKIHAMCYGNKRLDREVVYILLHDLLTAAMDSAIDMRNASCIMAAQAEKANNLGQYRLAERLGRHAESCEQAVKNAGGYEKPAPKTGDKEGA